MHSIQTKLILLISSAMLALALILGGMNAMNVNRLEIKRAANSMGTTVKNTRTEIDMTLTQTVSAVGYALNTTMSIVEYATQMRSPGFRSRIRRQLSAAFSNAVTGIDGIVGYYLHFSEELTGTSDGFWYTRLTEEEDFQAQQVTDVTKEQEEGDPKSRWYSIPVENGEAVWLPPYPEERTGLPVITYAVPIYKNGILIAVAGVDIRFSYLTDLIRQMTAYKSGYGYLASTEAELYYHPDFTEGSANAESLITGYEGKLFTGDSSEGSFVHYRYKDQKKDMVYQQLANGMYLALTVPEAEIFSLLMHTLLATAGVSLGLWGIFTLLTIMLARRMTLPLGELTRAAERIGEGDFGVELKESRARDEIGLLTAALNKTIFRMRDYVAAIQEMAYQDELTGVRNVASYDQKTGELEEKIKKGTAAFAVVMIDMNELKFINDHYGHEKGNVAILKMSRAICEIYAHSPVYRIGGDEFAVILENRDYQDRDALFAKLQKYQILRGEETDQPWEQIAFSAGMAIFSADRDMTYSEVFNRADADMYNAKERLKARHRLGARIHRP